MLIYEMPADANVQQVFRKGSSSVASRPKSSRLRQKIDNTYAYFSSKVDPLIAACVANFLFRQPVDVFNSMRFYFLHIRKGLGDNCFAKIECRNPKISQKIYFSETLGPLLAQVVDLITTSQPSDVVDFICCEFVTNKALSDSCGNTETKVEKFKRNLSATVRGNRINEVPNCIDTDQVRPSEAVVTDKLTVETFDKSGQKQSVKRGSISMTKNIQICMIGNGGSGKTSILNALQGIFDRKPKPSLGFKPISMQLGETVNVKFYDLGGGKKIRNIWSEYYHDVHAVLYVFDASLKGDQLEDSIALFQSTMMNPGLQDKPLLIIANKQDIKGALTAAQMSSFLDLRAYSNSGYVIAECVSFTSPSITDCFTPKAEPSATEDVTPSPENFLVDRRFENALESFLEIIQEHFSALDTRVISDTAIKKDLVMKKRLQRERKVLKKKISSVFRHKIDISLLPENLPDIGPDDSFTKEEGA
jgi:small GTP-binding protein